jgi:hypothetical protein
MKLGEYSLYEALSRLFKEFHSMLMATKRNQSTEGAEFVWVSECTEGAGCEIICIVPPMLSSVLIVVNWL